MDGLMHKDLAESGRWQRLPFVQQMANIGSEVYRAGNWKAKGRADRALSAADRALELLDLTIMTDGLIPQRRRELLRIRELLCDYFYGDNVYGSDTQSLNKYFDPFSFKAARQRMNDKLNPPA